MNVLILRRDGKIFVTVTADPIGDRGKQERWTDREVLQYLQSKNVIVGSLLKGGVLTNTNPDKIIHEWIFEDSDYLIRKSSQDLASALDKEILDELLATSNKAMVDSQSVKKRKEKRTVSKADEQ